MTREQVIAIAREAGAGEPESLFGRTDYIVMTHHELQRFAALVAAHEREECAKMIEEKFDFCGDEILAADAIRARGELK